jgi:hypothetical protein
VRSWHSRLGDAVPLTERRAMWAKGDMCFEWCGSSRGKYEDESFPERGQSRRHVR